MIQIPILTHWGAVLLEGDSTHLSKAQVLLSSQVTKSRSLQPTAVPSYMLKIKEAWEKSSPDSLPNWDIVRAEVNFDWTRLTEFQQKVLQKVALIPCGETRSYQEIAIAIGDPNSSRAVGGAVAKNPFWPLIPCHRVIQKNGKFGAYSGVGGPKFKSWILAMERMAQFEAKAK